MAKRQLHKRVISKDGEVRYFKLKKDKRGVEVYTRISDKEGAKAFIKKNYDKIKRDSTNLTNKEKKSLNRSKGQRSLFRFDGKAIPKKVSNFLIEEKILKKDMNRDLRKSNLNIKRPSDIETIYKNLLSTKAEGFGESSYGNSGYRNRDRVENLVNLREEISNWLDVGYRFVTYNVGDSAPSFGNEGFQAIRKFETNTYKEYFKDKASAFLRFVYRFRIDKDKKLVEVYLSEVDVKEGKSDPTKRTK